MNNKNHIVSIRNAKIEYNKIKYVESLALNGEKIYFNKYGFNHLIRKQKDLRSKDEQIRRLKLLSLVHRILISSSKIDNYRMNIVDGYPASFWSIKGYVEDKEVKVIIRQLGKGRKHFFSVMDMDNTKNAKDPEGSFR